MKLQGKKTGAFAGFIGWIEPDHAPIDPATGVKLLTVQYKDAGVNCYKDYETIAAFSADWEDYTPEPDPSFLIVKIQKLENSIKALDERLKTIEENSGEIKQYRMKLPPREKFERMKQDLSKADVAVNIMCHILAQEYRQTITALCAIGDDKVAFRNADGITTHIPYAHVVEKARDYINNRGGFEKLAEWGLI